MQYVFSHVNCVQVVKPVVETELSKFAAAFAKERSRANVFEASAVTLVLTKCNIQYFVIIYSLGLLFRTPLLYSTGNMGAH